MKASWRTRSSLCLSALTSVRPIATSVMRPSASKIGKASQLSQIGASALCCCTENRKLRSGAPVRSTSSRGKALDDSSDPSGRRQRSTRSRRSALTTWSADTPRLAQAVWLAKINSPSALRTMTPTGRWLIRWRKRCSAACRSASAVLRRVTSRWVPARRSAAPLSSRCTTRARLWIQTQSPLRWRIRNSWSYSAFSSWITCAVAASLAARSSG
mmetsp:Transcript_6866/g.16849  ORF Transcript_6866/g.16849 Transcript_6866/m.16849 type:complete len:214 (+) Transcript_6866:338-979(+)